MDKEHTITLDDYRWLLTDAAGEFLRQAAASTDSVRLVSRLRKLLTAEKTHLVVEQAELRAKARQKFSRAEEMFFTPLGLEQATDEVVATYKAARFPPGAAVSDLCCGIGGDLIALTARGPTTAVDRNEVAGLFAAANCRLLLPDGRLHDPVVLTSEVGEGHVAHCAAWHIDPDRRPLGRRTTHVDLHQPGPETINQLLSIQPNAAVKLAPAAELPAHWQANAELEWISRGRECRQLVAWFGTLARHRGLRSATVLARDGVRTVVGHAGTRPPTQRPIGRYIFEPDAAVLAAGLLAELAREYALGILTPNVAYLTGDSPTADLALACFEVEEVLPYDPKRVRALLRERDIGELEIKKRGVDLDPATVRRALKMPGKSAATLLLAPIAGAVTAILAHRVAT